MHPLLQLLATRPQLLADHAQAYAGLAGVELERVAGLWKRQALLGAAALVSASVTAVLAGVAVLLWAAIPAAQMPAAWMLPLVPAPTALVTAWCLLALRPGDQPGAFEDIRQQVAADIAMLREVGVR